MKSLLVAASAATLCLLRCQGATAAHVVVTSTGSLQPHLERSEVSELPSLSLLRREIGGDPALADVAAVAAAEVEHARTDLGPIEDLEPSLMVMVFSARKNALAKRNVIRKAWREVDKPHGQICTRFAMCEDPSDHHQEALVAEQAEFGDLVFLGCQEGYYKGALTRKLIAAMSIFVENDRDACMNRSLFMKVDDDTFASGHNFRHSVNAAWHSYADALYAGVYVPQGAPIRDPTSKWYEPESSWPHDYPPAMYGGPGYILGRGLVQKIIKDGIAAKYVLYDEDRSVGVWISKVQEAGMSVNFVHMRGTNGYQWDPYQNTGLWSNYPYAMQHHLSPFTISCLTELEIAGNAGAEVDGCFQKRH
mmetsp:Transcript_9856/g.22054  ORF Transcript_9856/g.22054 Transcript_9856/m.22054 type:complete len:363 (-) Transcript_9856:250-1338(-)